MLVWRFCVVGNNKTFLGVHAKLPMVLAVFNKINFFLQIFIKIPIIKFHVNRLEGGEIRREDTRTEEP